MEKENKINKKERKKRTNREERKGDGGMSPSTATPFGTENALNGKNTVFNDYIENYFFFHLRQFRSH